MVRPTERALIRELDNKLVQFHQNVRELPGIRTPARKQALLGQLIESMRRVKYVMAIKNRDVAQQRADPNDQLFDPLKAAIMFQREQNLDEAFWMVFLFVHFGRHSRGGWRYVRDVYGRLGHEADRWDWSAVSTDPGAFRAWLDTNQRQIQFSPLPGGFGNHRKYESLDAYSNTGTGAAVTTYVQWVRPPRTHSELMDEALNAAEGHPRRAFRALYRGMNAVARFGRTARFDYLAMVGKLGLAEIEPDSPYIPGSTGPRLGAGLLFGSQSSPQLLDEWLVELESRMGVGMQVLEDALCNWQKHPEVFVPFRG